MRIAARVKSLTERHSATREELGIKKRRSKLALKCTVERYASSSSSNQVPHLRSTASSVPLTRLPARRPVALQVLPRRKVGSPLSRWKRAIPPKPGPDLRLHLEHSRA